jgi:hypothetical protein
MSGAMDVLKGVAVGAAEAIPGASSAIRDYKQIKQISDNIAGYNMNKARKAEAEKMAAAAKAKKEEAYQAENDRRQKAMIIKGHDDRIRQEKAERAKASELMGVDVTNPSHYQLEMPLGVSSSPETETREIVEPPEAVLPSSHVASYDTSPTVKTIVKRKGKGMSAPRKVKFVMPKAPTATTPIARAGVPAKGGTVVPKAGFSANKSGFSSGKKVR